MPRHKTRLPALVAVLSLSSACDGDAPGPDEQTSKADAGETKADASHHAVFLDFEFDGYLLTNLSAAPTAIIEDQLLYTIGHLNENRSLGRLDKVELSNVRVSQENGLSRIDYHAKLPVAWGQRNDVPEAYSLTMPVNMSFDRLEQFAERYGHACVDSSAHDVSSGNMWYYYRPNRTSCQIDPGDAAIFEASVVSSDRATTGMFPEYARAWEDGELRVVAVFGKYEDGATSNNDAGIWSYNSFVQSIQRELEGAQVVTDPPQLPTAPGVAVPDITVEATLPDGNRVHVDVLLVDNVRTAGPAFDNRYAELSGTADLIAYSGHAGLGANIRALAQKGQWIAGQWVMVFMNGCDTYAYVDSALYDAHAAVNPDDPMGTKHCDIITNAMPSLSYSAAGGTMTLVRGLLSYEEPRTYEQIFSEIDSYQVVLVSGEEDNEFVPGGGGTVTAWDGLDESGEVGADESVRFDTPTLAAGRYRLELEGTGDADLYVGIGREPTVDGYDCRPFREGSQEVCEIELSAPAQLFVMVYGATPAQWSLRAGPM